MAAGTRSGIVAANVRMELAYRRQTKAELAVAIDVPLSTLYTKLRGESPWTIDETAAAAEYLGVPVEELYRERAS